MLDRFAQVEPVVLIAVDGYRFGGGEYDRREDLQALIEGIPSVRTTILIGSLYPRQAPPRWFRGECFDTVAATPRAPEFVEVDFEHPLWILYSSGTTGLPKRIVQSHGGILLEHLKSLGLGMDLRARDR